MWVGDIASAISQLDEAQEILGEEAKVNELCEMYDLKLCVYALHGWKESRGDVGHEEGS